MLGPVPPEEMLTEPPASIFRLLPTSTILFMPTLSMSCRFTRLIESLSTSRDQSCCALKAMFSWPGSSSKTISLKPVALWLSVRKTDFVLWAGRG